MKFIHIGVLRKVHIYVYLSKWCKVPNSEFKISRCCDWKCQDIVSCEGPGLFVLNQVYWPIRGQFSGHVTRILTNQRPVSRSQSSFRVSSCTLWDDYPNWLWSGEKLKICLTEIFLMQFTFKLNCILAFSMRFTTFCNFFLEPSSLMHECMSSKFCLNMNPIHCWNVHEIILSLIKKGDKFKNIKFYWVGLAVSCLLAFISYQHVLSYYLKNND